MEPDGSGLLTHLRRGTLEFCVLAMLRGGERYAVDLTHALSKDGVLVTSEGTVYPLLSRLRRDGSVASIWRESTSGPPRRYYRLTADGEAAVLAFESQWRRFRDAVDAALKGEASP
jgi:PadR family transcriptional regulator, regulatory protein PadR